VHRLLGEQTEEGVPDGAAPHLEAHGAAPAEASAAAVGVIRVVGVMGAGVIGMVEATGSAAVTRSIGEAATTVVDGVVHGWDGFLS